MKKVKLVAIVCAIVIIALYGMFLFILPNVVNLNNYKSELQKLVKDSANLNLAVSDLKLTTTPALHVGIRVTGLSLTYNNGDELVSADEAQGGIKLFPLIFKTVELSDIKLSNPSFSVRMLKGNKLDLVSYIEGFSSDSTEAKNSPELPFKFSKKLPKVVVSGYKLSAADVDFQNEIIVQGEELLIDKTVLDEKFHVDTNGKVLVNNEENIVYDLDIESFLPEVTEKKTPEVKSDIPNINFINEFVKLNLKALVDAQLKIKSNKDGLVVDGYANVDKMSLRFDAHTLPESFIHSVFSGKEIKLVSDLYISDIEKAQVEADIINSKKFLLDLNVKTDKLSFISLQKFLAGVFNSFNIRNDFNQFLVSGYMQGDFKLHTDLKKFESDGYFKVNNGSVQHKSLPIKINSILADVDFSKNNVTIKEAGANVNGAKLTASGKIDSKSVADILIVSDSLPLESIYAVVAPAGLKQSYDLQNGNLTLNAQIKGKLSEIAPKLSINLTNLKVKDKVNGIILSNRQSILNLVAKENSFDGDLNITSAAVQLSEPLFNLNVPSAQVKITPENIDIVPFSLMIENSPLKITGGVKDYMKSPKINILADGSLNSSDLLKLIPQESKSFVSSKGKLPVKIEVTGDDKSIIVNAQVKSDDANHFSPVVIKKLVNKSGLLNLSLNMKGNQLVIEDAGLYIMSRDFTSDMKKNLNNAQKLAEVYGEISDLSSGKIKKLEVLISEPLVLGLPTMPKTTLKARGRINAYGNMVSPKLNGFFEVKDADIAEFLTKVDLINVNLDDEIINADIQNLNINGSSINIKADAPSKFNKIFVINTVELTSPMIDADKVVAAFCTNSAAAASPGATSGNGNLLFPVKILKGHGVIDKLKSGNIEAQSLSGNFVMSNDNVQISDIKATAFDGTFQGKVSYNLATTKVVADVSGSSMDANKAVTAVAALKDQVMGSLDFNADINLSGVEYSQQMKTLKGNAEFTVKDGQLGSLGKLETFLQADNLLSQSFVKSEIGTLISSIAPYNTGKFSYLKGKMTFGNGIANISSITSSGPHMSLSLSGPYNLVNNNAQLQILGSLSMDVCNALGPITNLSIDKIAAYIPKFGSAISTMMGNYNLKANEKLLASIPELTPKQDTTKSFKVVLNGNMMNPAAAVKSFQWLNNSVEMESSQKSIFDLLKPSTTTNSTQSSEPSEQSQSTVSKDALKEGLKNQIEANPQVQKIKENEAVKTFGAIFNLYKDKINTPNK